MPSEKKDTKSSKKPAKLKDLSSGKVSSKKATAVKGGRKAQGFNHNQTLRAR